MVYFINMSLRFYVKKNIMNYLFQARQFSGKRARMSMPESACRQGNVLLVALSGICYGNKPYRRYGRGKNYDEIH